MKTGITCQSQSGFRLAFFVDCGRWNETSLLEPFDLLVGEIARGVLPVLTDSKELCS